MKKIYYLTFLTLLILTACQEQEVSPKIMQDNHNILTHTENIALKKHNELRQLHFTDANLIYSQSLEKAAQRHANQLAKNGNFTHDSTNLANKYGENLYRFSGTEKPNLTSIIQKWYDEKKYYNDTTEECKIGHVCGHYTQIVWKNSKHLGCASAKYIKGSYKNGYVTVCKYYPYGNIMGQDPY
ncbi:MAG: Unknown protein [uncultured Sulfurovum sp.]|uniref:SCP domain-containing protein n=1 Tax=uncultured Sulfurovum sp. TaxID=269237 RepID=A0A6S6S1E3_9BACT|nr:MAG: Unknown protein [uncultured Sulfurovum sp.]